ncbi:MAG: response regulator, partial [Myxococcales bacterium]|nr:response regulator [Myxococcales bacterium]
AGHAVGVAQPVDLREAVLNAVTLLKSSNHHGCVLRTELSAEAIVVSAVPAQLEQVVVNLVTNAREAIGEDGGMVVVRVRASRDETWNAIGSDEPTHLTVGSHAVLEVEDDGPGIDISSLALMFEPFHATKGRVQGLGLPAVQGIVRRNAGQLAVGHGGHGGTKVQIALPRAVEAEGVTAIRAPRAPREHHVLIIDDDEMVRTTLVRILGRNGFRTTTASSGAEAIEHVRSTPRAFDLILVDLTMPDMEGPDVLREVRKHTSIPALVMSGYGEAEVRAKFETLEVTGLVTKPFSQKALLSAVQDAWQKTSMLRA